MTIQIALTHPDGQVLGYPEPIDLVTYSLIEHDIGALHLRVGSEWRKALQYEHRLEVWRSLPMLGSRFIRSYFIETVTETTDETKRNELAIEAYDATALLKWRDIEAFSGSSAATKTNHADDIMKAYVREQLVGSIDPLDTSYFSVEEDTHEGPSMTVAKAWDNLLEAVRAIANKAAGVGTPVYFQVAEGDAPATYQFQTRVGQLGVDHSSNSEAPLLIGLGYGNVRSVTYTRDAMDEVNQVISAGTGQGTSRKLGENEDTSRSGRNIWARKKLVYNDSEYSTTATLNDAAARRVREGRPVEKIAFELTEAPGFHYGYDWNFGDRLTVTHAGTDYSGVVKAVTFWTYENGAERLQAVLEVDA